MTDINEEIEAAALEGIAPMPEDLIALREEKLLLDLQIEQLEGRKKEITAIFGARLQEDGLKAYSLNGKNHATASEFTEHRIDSKLLKNEMPHIFQKYAPARDVRRITVR